MKSKIVLGITSVAVLSLVSIFAFTSDGFPIRSESKIRERFEGQIRRGMTSRQALTELERMGIEHSQVLTDHQGAFIRAIARGTRQSLACRGHLSFVIRLAEDKVETVKSFRTSTCL